MPVEHVAVEPHPAPVRGPVMYPDDPEAECPVTAELDGRGSGHPGARRLVEARGSRRSPASLALVLALACTPGRHQPIRVVQRQDAQAANAFVAEDRLIFAGGEGARPADGLPHRPPDSWSCSSCSLC
jgi:hypothetical protein